MAAIFTATGQDNAASTTLVATPANGTLTGAGNTSASSVAGPGGNLPLAITLDGVDDYGSFATVAASGTSATYVLLVKIPGATSAFDGLLHCRGAAVCGMNIADLGGNELGYIWNATLASYSWNSGVIIPTNEWCLVAVAVNSTTAVVYCISASGVDKATNTISHASVSFCQTPKIGTDLAVGDRFSAMSWCGAQIHDTTLSEAALQAIWDAAQPASRLLQTNNAYLSGAR